MLEMLNGVPDIRNPLGSTPRVAPRAVGHVENLLRVADLVCDAHCTFVQLRFSTKSAAARDGFRGARVLRDSFILYKAVIYPHNRRV
jgi:hypothetical protein